jgi:hypothetical protein
MGRIALKQQNQQQLMPFQLRGDCMQANVKLPLMLGSACFLGLFAGLGAGSPSLAAVSESSASGIGNTSGLITEVSAGKQADLAVSVTDANSTPTTLVVLPSTSFLAAANTVDLPTSSVAALATVSGESAAGLPVMASPTTESGVAPTAVIEIPTLAADMPAP